MSRIARARGQRDAGNRLDKQGGRYGGGIDDGNTGIKDSKNIGQCLSIGIMKMHGYLFDWNNFTGGKNHFHGRTRCTTANGVT